MVRGLMIALGIGLLILWIVGLQAGSAGWLLWLDFVGGVLSIIGGAALTDAVARYGRLGEPLFLSVGLFVLWIIALAVGMAAWKTWWTFAFACAYLLVALAAGTERAPMTRTTTSPRPA